MLDDGCECDMDLGTYERFLNIDLSGDNNITGGKILKYVIDNERKGVYLGDDVQIVPHLTNEIKKWIKRVGSNYKADVVLIEVGGTVGDLENAYFIEAMRQLTLEERGNVAIVQVTYVPVMDAVGEQKTKPTQHATRALQGMGVQPDIILCRSGARLSADARRKIAMFCNVQPEAVIDDYDSKTIYGVPRLFESQNLSRLILDKLGLKGEESNLKNWNELIARIENPKKKVTVAITGKYTALKDAYVSIKEALVHAGASADCEVDLRWVETTDIVDSKSAAEALKGCDGIIVPGGYGPRGTEGKVECARYARENDLPYLGLCFGMQYMVVEFARNVCGMNDANSTEADPKTTHPVVDLMPEQKFTEMMGATNRLGLREIAIKDGTFARKLYGKDMAMERFRHRYEINLNYVNEFEKNGLIFSGASASGKIMEIAELKGKRFYRAPSSILSSTQGLRGRVPSSSGSWQHAFRRKADDRSFRSFMLILKVLGRHDHPTQHALGKPYIFLIAKRNSVGRWLQ